ncbi:MAG: LytR/AlgR family response regulator transcription factor [Lachnotalea sp.]
MKIAIVDDQFSDVIHLEKYFKKYFLEIKRDYQIETFSDATSFLTAYTPDFDFVIFDIDMPKLNGIDAAKQLRKIDPDIVLMFVTNMPQYALDGYSVDAIDYVLKPLSYPDFRLKMQKAIRYIVQDQDPRISINAVNEYRCFHVSDIYYIESQLHYLIYHTKNGDFKTRSTLNDIEAKLTPCHFARCSVSYLINLKYLESIHGYNILVHGTLLRISRTKKNAFLSAFTKYMGGLS